jgi:hypothetical protein
MLSFGIANIIRQNQELNEIFKRDVLEKKRSFEKKKRNFERKERSFEKIICTKEISLCEQDLSKKFSSEREFCTAKSRRSTAPSASATFTAPVHSCY